MANYCKNLWIKYGELQSACQSCAGVLESAKKEGKNHFADFDAALSDTEATLAEMQEEWDNSFETLPNGEKIFGPEYEAIVEFDRLNPPGLNIDDYQFGIENGFLRDLDLDFETIQDLSPIGFLTRLKSLSIHSFIENTPKNSEVLKKLTNLNTLSLSNLSLPNIPWIKDLDALQFLALSGLKLKNLDDLAGLPSLKRLNLSGMDELVDVSALEKIPLLGLTISNCSNVSDINAISGCANLEALSITNTPINDITPIKNLHKLRSISLINTKVTDISPLANLPLLGIINLVKTSVRDLGPTLTIPNLKNLTLSEKDSLTNSNVPVIQRLITRRVKVSTK